MIRDGIIFIEGSLYQHCERNSQKRETLFSLSLCNIDLTYKSAGETSSLSNVVMQRQTDNFIKSFTHCFLRVLERFSYSCFITPHFCWRDKFACNFFVMIPKLLSAFKNNKINYVDLIRKVSLIFLNCLTRFQKPLFGLQCVASCQTKKKKIGCKN